MKVVNGGFPLGDEPLANADRKRQVGQAGAVEVSELAPTHPEFDEIPTSRLDANTGPTAHALPEGFGDIH